MKQYTRYFRESSTTSDETLIWGVINDRAYYIGGHGNSQRHAVGTSAAAQSLINSAKISFNKYWNTEEITYEEAFINLL